MGKNLQENTENWYKLQEGIYSNRGFGETGRAFIKAREKNESIQLEFLGNPPKKLLDVGCNDGTIVSVFRQLGYETVGIDFPVIIEKAKKLHPDCNFKAVNLDGPEDSCPKFKNTFDMIYAGEIIEHMIYDIPFLERLVSYLKSDGVLIVTTPKSADGFKSEHMRFYPRESLMKLFELCGLKVIHFRQNNTSNIIVGRKP